jgi:CheY-like chemotaxis protein
MTDATDARHHVLVVDDEPAVAQLLSRILESLGYRVTVCAGGEGALVCFHSDPQGVDLLFTDFRLPGLDGLQLSQALLQTRPDLPVVVCTGDPGDLPPRETWPAAVRGVLTKPVRRGQIAAAVEQALQPRATPAAPPG